jgi:hypothetical protein
VAVTAAVSFGVLQQQTYIPRFPQSEYRSLATTAFFFRILGYCAVKRCRKWKVEFLGFDGKVKRSNSREYGRSVLIIEGEGEEGTSELFKGLGIGPY